MSLKPLKNPWALKDGSLVHITSVDPATYETERKKRRKEGTGHSYLCPRQSCRDVLYPKALLSEEKRGHFAHLTLDCDMTHETAIHEVAKAIIMERRYLWLPELPASPNAPHPIIQPRREMLGSRITPESFVLGRWWADIEIEDHPGPFAIFEEEGEPILLVEIVVTSPVSQEKVEAVQRAGMKMIAIKLEKEDADSADLPNMILRSAEREWLAHPAWMEECQAEWAERERIREAERLAEEARVEDIIARIRSGHPPEWQARNEVSIDRFVEDQALSDLVGIDVPGSHWMAGKPRWWQATLLRCLYYDRISLKKDAEAPAIPEASECLSAIRGFIIPFREDETDPRLLDSVGVSREQWSTPEKVVSAYLKALVDRKYLRRLKGAWHPVRRYYGIGYRHREIDQHLLLLLEGDSASGTSEERIFDWKSQRHRFETRRTGIIIGGRTYEIILAEAEHTARAARRRREAPHYYDDGDDYRPRSPTSLVAAARPEAPMERALSSVREDHGDNPRQKSFFERGDGRDELRRAYKAPPRMVHQGGHAVQTPISSSPRSHADRALWQGELRKGLIAFFRGRNNTPDRARSLTDFFMNQNNSRLGAKPVDYCDSKERMDECLRAAAGR